MEFRVIPVPDFHKQLAASVEQLHENTGCIWWWHVVEYAHGTHKCDYC